MTSNVAEITDKLGQAFDAVITKQYGKLRAPSPIITPTGIRHLDGLLGGGLLSSGAVLFSSTPETGKSTIAFQVSKMFQAQYENSIIIYLDIEGAGNTTDSTQFRMSRIDAFGLDLARFKYEPVLLDVPGVFNMIASLVDVKHKFEEKTGQEFKLMVVWDSIPATPSDKTAEVDDPNKVIGLKARQLSFCLEKFTPMLKFDCITFICIDQVRANLQIQNQYAQREKSVGMFKDMKAASNIYSLQHHTQQWVFFSKKKQITAADKIGIDGWYIDVLTEKNKLAPSQHIVTCVFDKARGLDKFWSEYTFLSDKTTSEKKIYKDKKMPFPLMIFTSGSYSYLHVTNPDDPSIEYKSQKFYRKNAKQMYEQDETFRKWFDYAIEISVLGRISYGMFHIAPDGALNMTSEDETEEESHPDVINPVVPETATDDTQFENESEEEPEDSSGPSILDSLKTNNNNVVQDEETGDVYDSETGEVFEDEYKSTF